MLEQDKIGAIAIALVRVKPSDLGLSIFIFNLCLFYVQRYLLIFIGYFRKNKRNDNNTLHTKSLNEQYYCCVMSAGRGRGEYQCWWDQLSSVPASPVSAPLPPPLPVSVSTPVSASSASPPVAAPAPTSLSLLLHFVLSEVNIRLTVPIYETD